MDTSDGDSAAERLLTDREAAILERIRNHGAFTCTGGCEQRQSGQLHCVHLAREMGTSNHKIWKVIGTLADRGLLERRWEEDERCWRFTLTRSGHDILAPRASMSV